MIQIRCQGRRSSRANYRDPVRNLRDTMGNASARWPFRPVRPSLAGGRPVAHADPPVHRMPVHDQVDLPVEVADQTLEEVQETAAR